MECPNCKRKFFNSSGICPICTDAYHQESERLQRYYEVANPADPMLRAIAFIIDMGIMGVLHLAILTVSSSLLGASMLDVLYPSFEDLDHGKLNPALVVNGWFLLVVAPCWLYFAVLESSKWQATIGKRAVGIGVTDMGGNRIGFATASFRYFMSCGFAGVVGGMMSRLGPMAGFTYTLALGNMYQNPERQAGHDRATSTLVLRDPGARYAQTIAAIGFALSIMLGITWFYMNEVFYVNSYGEVHVNEKWKRKF
jgi:uncharacterized RDD family membrane protein YckC